MIKNEKKAKEREKKEIEAMNRKHLANMRVVQKSLVYVIGLPTKLANDEVYHISNSSIPRPCHRQCKILVYINTTPYPFLLTTPLLIACLEATRVLWTIWQDIQGSS
jgi:hypothetical protein